MNHASFAYLHCVIGLNDEDILDGLAQAAAVPRGGALDALGAGAAAAQRHHELVAGPRRAQVHVPDKQNQLLQIPSNSIHILVDAFETSR